MAELSCAMKCLKYLLFVFNVLLWVLGLAVFGVGICSRNNSKNFDSLLSDGNSIVKAADILICAGIIIAIIGFIGCCGSWRESKVLLLIYAIFIITSFVFQIAAGALAGKIQGKDLTELDKRIKQVVNIDYDVVNPTRYQKSLTKALDWFQEHVECCGGSGADEWANSTWFNRRTFGSASGNSSTVALVPKSCCRDPDAADCNMGVKGDKPSTKLVNSIYVNGCVDKGREYVKDHMWPIGGVGAGIVMVEGCVGEGKDRMWQTCGVGIGITTAHVLGLALAIILYGAIHRAIGYDKLGMINMSSKSGDAV